MQNNLPEITESSSLKELQEYAHQAVLKRGFDKESPRDIMLLMVEEVGELAKSLRKFIGLKTDAEKSEKYSKVQEELADVLFYLLDLAGSCNIDLFQAFKEKEEKNNQRTWK